MEPIIGIDLGTTNSEVTYIFDGQCEIITDNDDGIVPSCVGFDPQGALIVGRKARNQAIVAPERTALSVKRSMGTDHQFTLGHERFTPQEISAFILKHLKQRAEAKLGQSVGKAVITVPAYFTDAQRQATREAGQLAGLEVVRIINEPTAAALAYESLYPEDRRVLIYDLGGGTFDVSIVRIEAGVVEVLASTGDNHLGGDDFDQCIVAHLAEHLNNKYQLAAKGDVLLTARLRRAAEKAKIQLSEAPFAMVEEDHVGQHRGREIHLSLELARRDFEAMIAPMLEKTMDAVNQALKDTGMLPSAIEQIILVGGSTRIPRIAQLIEEKFRRAPHSTIDPDLCVAVGAGLQASREMGRNDSGVLVDITPYTFGTSAIGELDGTLCRTHFVPLIRRNTKLPARKSEVFYTMADQQQIVDVLVYQGEAPDALENVRLGNYQFNLTPAPAGAEIVLHYDLDLNGILKIKAVEKQTGKAIDAVIENAFANSSGERLEDNRQRIVALWGDDQGQNAPKDKSDAAETPPQHMPNDLPPIYAELFQRANAALDEAGEDDRDEMINLMEDIRNALTDNRPADAEGARATLDDILFYLE